MQGRPRGKQGKARKGISRQQLKLPLAPKPSEEQLHAHAFSLFDLQLKHFVARALHAVIPEETVVGRKRESELGTKLLFNELVYGGKLPHAENIVHANLHQLMLAVKLHAHELIGVSEIGKQRQLRDEEKQAAMKAVRLKLGVREARRNQLEPFSKAVAKSAFSALKQEMLKMKAG